MNKTVLQQLIDKGVQVPNPETVYVSEDVDPGRISGKGVVLYSGTKLTGSRTLIMENCVIGYEAPAVVEDTLVGPGSRLNGGFFQGAVFLGQNVFGSGGHVRSGTILEEEANAAHTVGLKQTILFPFVTLGSLINFCDCLMAGGTSRKDHSEVGSSFIHFNYTPNQDKATPSMFGDVCRGVMLDQPPVFLGGQGGVVGPVALGFGCITAAGSIVRKSEEKSNRLILGGGLRNMSIPRQPGIYSQVGAIYNRNLGYIAELIALRAWYRYVRPLFIVEGLGRELILGLQDNLDRCIGERIKRFTAWGQKLVASRQLMSESGKDGETLAVHDRAIRSLEKAEAAFDAFLARPPESPEAENFLREVEAGITAYGPDYVPVIQGLPEAAKASGTRWMSDISGTVIRSLEL